MTKTSEGPVLHQGKGGVLRLVFAIKLMVLMTTGVLAGQAQSPVATSLNAVPVTLDRAQYEPFLREPWKEGRNAVYMVMDPNCRYCLKALNRLDQLQVFNTYVFWAPILVGHAVNSVTHRKSILYIHSCNTISTVTELCA